MNFETIKTEIQLATYIEGLNLKRVASTGGGEFAGPCPFCGGHDRFRVQPANNIWLCRYCKYPYRLRLSSRFDLLFHALISF